MHPSKPRVDCRDRFRRRKRLMLIMWACFLPFLLGTAALGLRFFKSETLLLPWGLINAAYVAWWIRLQACPHCGGSVWALGMLGVWWGSDPLIHDCGAVLQ